jgi:glyoxylase-like metal-dependent hydrolase (beta-lactamase superfamily II)
MADQIRVGNVDVAVARDSYWEGAPASHLRDLANKEIPLADFSGPMEGADPTQVIKSRVLTFVLRAAGKTILLDAGVGGWGLWRFGDGYLPESLAALGVAPEEVDYVVPSHLHLDHIGWNTHPGPGGEPVITFPNATYLFHDADWDHFTSPALLKREDPDSRPAKVADTCLFPISNAGRMQLVSGAESRITDEVTILHTPGHTPGSVSVMIESAGEAAIFIGDLVHLCVQLTEPKWSPPYESDREASTRSRLDVVERAIGRNALVAGSHLDEGPIFGRMVPVNGRRFWRGVE